MQDSLNRSLRQIVCASALVLPGAAILGSLAPVAVAQAPAAASRILGTVTAIAAGSIKVKPDNGVEHTITVPDGIKIQRVAPGATSLANAATINFSDIAVGDRVLVRLGADASADPATA